jgi:MFS family permease
MMIPQGLGVIREVFPAEELPKAFGLFGPVMGSAALLGPIIGGGLVSLNLLHDAWRPVFLINVPLGLLAGIGAVRLLPRIGSRHVQTLDAMGALLAAAGSLAIIYPLIEGRALGWPAWTYASIAGGVLLFGAFALHLLRLRRLGRDPLVEPSIFAHRGYSAGALVLMLYFGAMIGVVLALTLFLQLGEGFSAVHAGLTLAPFALGTAISAPAGATLSERLGGRLLIQAGGLVSLLSNAGLAVILTRTSHVSSWGLTGPLLAYGIGMGLFIVPAFDTIIAAVSDAETGSASGTLNAIQQLGGAIGVAVLGTVFFSALRREGFALALRDTIWWQVAGLGLMLLVSPLLPARARPAEGAPQSTGGAEPVAQPPTAVPNPIVAQPVPGGPAHDEPAPTRSEAGSAIV